MIKNRILKNDFQSYTQKDINVYHLMFSKKDEENTDYCIVTEEMLYGELSADNVRKFRIKELEARDSSPEVNEFTYMGKPMWFDKVTRTCIVYSMNTEKAAGKTETELYDNDGQKYILPIDTAIELFGALELYAKACYNQTQAHKDALFALDDVNDILAYDITTGYPPKININE